MRFQTYEDIEPEALKANTPLFAEFELTYICNLRCVHCYVHKDNSKNELNLNEFKSVIKQLAAAKVFFLGLGGGEPLIRNDFFEIAQYARDLGFALTIKTNATLITKEVADKIMKIAPHQINVSLYGPSEKTFGRITGHPDLFRKAIDGIHLLAERELPLRINYTLFKFHTPEDIMMVRRIAKSCNAFLKADIWLDPKHNGSFKPLRFVLPQLRRDTFMRIMPEAFSIQRAVDKVNIGVTELVCRDARFKIEINPYGYVGNCFAPLSKDNIRDKPVIDIWRNDPLLKAHRELRWGDILEHSNKCLDCGYFERYCGNVTVTCPASNFSVYKSLVKIPQFYCQRVECKAQWEKKFKRPYSKNQNNERR